MLNRHAFTLALLLLLAGLVLAGVAVWACSRPRGYVSSETRCAYGAVHRD